MLNKSLVISYLSPSSNNNITLVWFSEITSCSYMFQGLTNIISIDMSNFDFSNVLNMEYMFTDCSSLKYLNLNNIDTSGVTKMTNLFTNCRSLTYLNLYSLDTSNVECLCNLFNGCSSLKYLNIINLKDPLSCNYDKIFENCDLQLKSTLDGEKAPELVGMIRNYQPCLYLSSDYYDVLKDKCLQFCLLGSSEKYLSNKCFDKCYNYDYDKIECFASIPYGYYKDDSVNNKLIKKCDIKCETCNTESISKNLCTSCNINSFFYPIIDGIINPPFYNCTNNLDGYYLEDNSYKPCYHTCKSCSEKGYSIDHKCEECYPLNRLIYHNCLEPCDKFYYYNKSLLLYECVEECPSYIFYADKYNIC